MANPAHLEKLCLGPRAWNAWREENPDLVPELSGIQLTLNQRQLGPSNGGPINLSAADLDGASLRYATLSGANFEDARLVGADLTHARLDNAQLMGANLTDAQLDQADLTRAALDHAVLFGADLSNARNLTSAQLELAYGDASTRLPGHIQPPKSWFPIEDEAEESERFSGWGGDGAGSSADEDIYQTLGVATTATSEEIRTVYRNLVKKLHPDLNPNDREAQERFKRVTKAYGILSDPEERARYDRGEIDGEGNINPEFEARRRFRRTAVKYYAAAAASFLLAVGVLAGVWHTVLFRDRGSGTEQVVVAETPKRSERLGGEPAEPSARPGATKPETVIAGESPAKSETARLIQEPGSHPAPMMEPPARQQAAAIAEPSHGAPETTEPQGPANSPAGLPSKAQEPAGGNPTSHAAAPSPEPAPTRAETAQPATPAPAAAQPAKLEQPAQTPSLTPPQLAAVPPPPGPGASEPRPVSQGAAPETAPMQAGSPQALAAGNTPRPLQEAHNGLAGQTSPSSPEPWSVAALPFPPAADAGETRQRASHGAASELPFPARRPPAPNAVARMLGKRAIKQTLGKRAAPILARSDAAPGQGRRALSPADVPTNAIPHKRNAPSGKRLAAAEAAGRRRTAGPSQSPRSLASASEPPMVPQVHTYEARQHQAVSDILAGGM